MSILDKILKSKSDPIQERVEDVQSVIEETDAEKETARKQAVQFVLQLIEENPDMPIREFIPTLYKNTSLTHDEIGEIIIQLPDIKSEKAVIAAVQSTDLPSETIANIATQANISTDVAEKIVEEIEDEDIQKEQQKRIELERKQKLLDELSKVYNSCEYINYLDLQDFLMKAQKINRLQYSDAKITNKIQSIIAKRAALDCMLFGDVRISPLTKIIPSLDMLEKDLPAQAYKEYKTLRVEFDDQKKKYKEFSPETQKAFHDAILKDIAIKTAENYDQVGEFTLPETEKFKQLNKEDIDLFIKNVETHSHNFDKFASRKLTKLLNGNISKLDENIDNIDALFKKLPISEDEKIELSQVVIDLLEQKYQSLSLVNKAKKENSHSSQEDDGNR